MGHKGLRRGEVVFQVCVGGFEQEIGSGDARATATPRIPWAHRGWAHPTGDGVPRNLDAAAAMEQRIVQRILDELRELLSKRLDVAIFDHAWRGMEIRTEH